MLNHFLSPAGRISRRSYVAEVVLPLTLLNALQRAVIDIPSLEMTCTIIIGLLGIAPAIRRFHDSGLSAAKYWQIAGAQAVTGFAAIYLYFNAAFFGAIYVFFALCAIALIATIAMLYILLFRKGETGRNPYGPDPLEEHRRRIAEINAKHEWKPS